MNIKYNECLALLLLFMTCFASQLLGHLYIYAKIVYLFVTAICLTFGLFVESLGHSFKNFKKGDKKAQINKGRESLSTSCFATSCSSSGIWVCRESWWRTAAENDFIPRFEGMLLHCTIGHRILEHAWWRTWRTTARAPLLVGAHRHASLRVYISITIVVEPSLAPQYPVPISRRWDFLSENGEDDRERRDFVLHLSPFFTDFREREHRDPSDRIVKQWDPGYCGCPFCWSSWPTEASPVLTSTTVVSYDSSLNRALIPNKMPRRQKFRRLDKCRKNL